MINGYPEHVLTTIIEQKINNFNESKRFGPKCPVYLRLPWIGPRESNIYRQN